MNIFRKRSFNCREGIENYYSSDKEKESMKNKKNPSAQFLVEACYNDYIRLLNNYNKLYEKSNIALAFVGIVLTIMINISKFSTLYIDLKELNMGQFFLFAVEIVCNFLGLILLIVSAVQLLHLIKGKRLPVFNSVDIKEKEKYKEQIEDVAVWLIDSYTQVVSKIKPFIEEKQKLFDSSVTLAIIGLILCFIAIILQKGGF